MKRDVLLVSALLAVLVLVEWLFPISMPNLAEEVNRSSASSSNGQDAALVADLETPPPVEHYEPMRQRPLFVETRRVPDASPVETKTDGRRSRRPPTFGVSAIISHGGETYAILRSPKGGKNSENKLRVGDEKDGWRVEKIQSDRLVLSNRGESHELELRTFKPVATSAAKQRTRVNNKRQARTTSRNKDVNAQTSGSRVKSERATKLDN
ncbi:MAG: hypothetical protein ACWA5Q_05945 [bacterium]